MKDIKVNGMLTGLKAAIAYANKHGKGAKEIRIICSNGFACLKKQGNTYIIKED